MEIVENADPKDLAKALLNRESGSFLSQLETLERILRFNLITMQRSMLDRLYVENEIIKAICQVPIDDALRGGITISTAEVETSEIEELESVMTAEDDLGILGEGLIWGRLFGGGGFIVVTNDDPATPLEIEKLHNKKVSFKSFDRWELSYTTQAYEVGDIVEPQFWEYYGRRVHSSRVVIFRGDRAPSLTRPTLMGWGLSVVENLVRAINQFVKTSDLTFEVLDEFKIDIFKINGLSAMLGMQRGEQIVRQRVDIANREKNYLKAITLDGEDDYQQKNLNFAGLSEVMSEIRMQIACALRMPITKIFGTSSGGFSDGDEGIKNYNAMIESTIRARIKPEIMKILKIRFVQKFGFVPKDLKFEMQSLEIHTESESEDIKNKKFERLCVALEKGVITNESFAEACNKNNLLPASINPAEILKAKNERKEDIEDGDVAARNDIERARGASNNSGTPILRK